MTTHTDAGRQPFATRDRVVRRLRRAVVPVFIAFMVVGSIAGQTPPQKWTPPPVRPSDIQVRIEPVGRIPSPVNPTSPTVAGGVLLLIDQAGHVFRWDGAQAHELLSQRTAPTGLKLIEREGVLNVAANASGSKVYVMFISSSVPRGVPQRRSVRDLSDAWYVLYEYDFDEIRLSNPRPVTALQVRSEGHTGGGLAVTAEGVVLFAAGDNGDSYEDGRDYSQAPENHLAKILKITPSDGSVSVAAVGVRSAQRLAVYGRASDARLDFIDDGGWVAEELNSVRVTDLLTSEMPLNFGWGRNRSDRKSREGNFYIDMVGNSVASIDATEAGFRPPIAEFGREAAAAVGATGPVSSVGFSRIASLFGDLVSGAVFVITQPAPAVRQDVLRVTLVDAQGQPTTLNQLAGNRRPDPRFFNFPDGTPGVLLEATGTFYRLSEVR